MLQVGHVAVRRRRSAPRTSRRLLGLAAPDGPARGAGAGARPGGFGGRRARPGCPAATGGWTEAAQALPPGHRGTRCPATGDRVPGGLAAGRDACRAARPGCPGCRRAAAADPGAAAASSRPWPAEPDVVAGAAGRAGQPLAGRASRRRARSRTRRRRRGRRTACRGPSRPAIGIPPAHVADRPGPSGGPMAGRRHPARIRGDPGPAGAGRPAAAASRRPLADLQQRRAGRLGHPLDHDLGRPRARRPATAPSIASCTVTVEDGQPWQLPSSRSRGHAVASTPRYSTPPACEPR